MHTINRVISLLNDCKACYINYKSVFIFLMINITFKTKRIKKHTTKDGNKCYHWDSTLSLQYLRLCMSNLNTPLKVDSVHNLMKYIKKDCVLTFKFKDIDIRLHTPSLNLDFIGVFTEYYVNFCVKNVIVIDIGGYVGDSAIYFAINGASKVISIEPFLKVYNYEKENININNLENIVTSLNTIYNGENTTYFIEDDSDVLGKDANNNNNNNGIETKTISLEKLVQQYGISKGVLKMTCEGCEQNIIKESTETLQHFNEIIIRYYYGYEQIKRKLESAGFKVKYTKPIKRYIAKNSHPHQIYGTIYAKL